MALTSVTFPPAFALALKLGVVAPLALACLLAALAFPFAARKGRLTIPACAGIGIAAVALALLAGHVAGGRKITGTAWGLGLAVAFFLMSSTAVGAFVALFFYREPPEA